jgi:hypothetical protein
MKKLVVLGLLVGFLVWRKRAFDASDRRNGYGAYANLRPVKAD